MHILIPDAVQSGRIDETERFHRKGTRQAGRAMRCAEGSLNQQGAGSTAGIMKRHPRAPRAQFHQRGSERFPKRRFAVPGTIATAGQGSAGGIQQNFHPILMHRYLYRKISSRFRKDTFTCPFPELLNDSFLRDGLAVPGTHKPGTRTMR